MASTTMYTCPRFNDSSPEIPLPNCMYEMSNIQGAMQEGNGKQSHPPEIADLLQRQMKILKDLDVMTRQIDALKKKAGIKDEDLKNALESKMEKIQTPLKVLEEDLDIVITGKPSNPPMSAFVIINYLKQQGIKLAVACHKHSSLKDPVPFDLMKSIGWKNSIIQSHEKLTFTFIWKEDQFGPSIIVNPRVQTAIKGDANIARFLCRKFLPHLFESLDENGTLIADFLMDLATTKVVSGSVEETKKALKMVDKQIGNNTWLVNNHLTIADFVVFSAIKISKNTALMSHNLQKWFKNIAEKFCQL